MTSNKLTKSTLYGLVGILLLAVAVGLGIYASQKAALQSKYAPIQFIPPETAYNLQIADQIIQDGYEQLQAAYAALGKNPQDVNAALSRADAYLKVKDTARAILSYQWVNRNYPDNVTGWIGIADIYVYVGRIDDAKTSYQTVLKLEPNNTSVQDKLNKILNKS